MLDRVRRSMAPGFVRKALRDKLIRVVEEALLPYHKVQLGRIDDLQHQLNEALRYQGDRLAELTANYEHRERRDLLFAAERDAAADSAAFALQHLRTAPHFPDPHATLLHALSLLDAEVEGMVLEFGVYTGTTLKIMANASADREIYGFDSFTGLPEDWRTGFSAGAFGVEQLPEVPGAELIAGWFDETLPGFVAEHAGPVAFLHVDCDLYSSTKTVLEHIGPRLRAGSVVLFDEYFNYQGWRDHEHKAWMEYTAETGIEFSYEGYTTDHEQVIVRITKVPGQSGR
ncbi:class I SAM-dependent methyltransferase [Lentzea albidocapillata]|uniref:Macrocin-O-methyltransferase (TylF) n=1 Tax=Lentzea albidocapillata TaxID=40571 RepID=A0A1W2FIE6_9PSEU|nr:class I SAM-dependent methyltransferase [Lentzea albidocapillata]SMD21442.1 Macrocin-O-methyltransferase (TylF) [Lentzea albidocapillata]